VQGIQEVNIACECHSRCDIVLNTLRGKLPKPDIREQTVGKARAVPPRPTPGTVSYI